MLSSAWPPDASAAGKNRIDSLFYHRMFLLEKSLCMNGMFLCVKNTERPPLPVGCRGLDKLVGRRKTGGSGSATRSAMEAHPKNRRSGRSFLRKKLGIPAQVARVQKFIFREFNFRIFTFYALIIAYFFDFVNRLFAFFQKFFGSSPWAGWANAARTGQNGGVTPPERDKNRRKTAPAAHAGVGSFGAFP